MVRGENHVHLGDCAKAPPFPELTDDTGAENGVHCLRLFDPNVQPGVEGRLRREGKKDVPVTFRKSSPAGVFSNQKVPKPHL